MLSVLYLRLLSSLVHFLSLRTHARIFVRTHVSDCSSGTGFEWTANTRVAAAASSNSGSRGSNCVETEHKTSLLYGYRDRYAGCSLSRTSKVLENYLLSLAIHHFTNFVK